MVFLCLDAMLWVERPYLLPSKVGAAAELQVHAHRCRLINHYNPFPVAETHHLFAVWIMAGTEAVGALPFHQRNVLGVHRQVDAAAIGEGVLMLPVALKIEGTAINQELAAFHLDGAHPIGQGILILAKSYPDIIEVGLQRLPEDDILNQQLPF